MQHEVIEIMMLFYKLLWSLLSTPCSHPIDPNPLQVVLILPDSENPVRTDVHGPEARREPDLTEDLPFPIENDVNPRHRVEGGVALHPE
jgi:hypothetical protein